MEIIDISNDVKQWGLPNILENYKFEIDESYSGDTEVAFSIEDGEGKEIFEFSCGYIDLTMYEPTSSPYMSLNDICVFNPNDRKKGIASFYLEKFKKMCLDNNVDEIIIVLCTSKENINYYRGYNNNKSLSEFYIKALEHKDLKVTFSNNNFES